MGCLCSTMEVNFFRSLLYLREEASLANTSCSCFVRVLRSGYDKYQKRANQHGGLLKYRRLCKYKQMCNGDGCTVVVRGVLTLYNYATSLV